MIHLDFNLGSILDLSYSRTLNQLFYVCVKLNDDDTIGSNLLSEASATIAVAAKVAASVENAEPEATTTTAASAAPKSVIK